MGSDDVTAWHGFSTRVLDRRHGLKTRATKRQRLAAQLALLIACALFLTPFLWMVSTSLKTIEQVMSDSPTLIPHPFALENYARVLTNPSMHFLLFARNTLIVASLSVIGNVSASALAAYAFARIRFAGAACCSRSCSRR